MQPQNKIKILLLFSVLFTTTVDGVLSRTIQLSSMDSLKNELQNERNDTVRVKIYLNLAFRYHRIQVDSAEYYSKLGYNEAKKIQFDNGIAAALGTLGIIEYAKSNYKQALNYYDQAINMYSKLNDEHNISRVNNYIGVIHRLTGNYFDAIKIYLESLRITENLKDEKGMSFTYNNLGVTYGQLGEYDSALSYYYKSAELKSKLGDEKALATTYSNIGNLKIKLNDLNSAEEFILKAIKLQEDMQDIKGIGQSSQNIGFLKFKQGLNENAKKHFEKALIIYTRLNDKREISNVYNLQSLVAIDENQFDKALDLLKSALKQKREIGDQYGEAKVLKNMAICNYELRETFAAKNYAKKSLRIAQKIGAKAEAQDAAEFLHTISHEAGKTSDAYKYLTVSHLYKDSLFNEQKNTDIARIESLYALSGVQKENELLQKEQEINQSKLGQNTIQIENQNNILIALFVCLILTILAAIFWYLYTQRKHKTLYILQKLNTEISQQKEKIEKQALELEKTNKEIGSINLSLENLVEKRTKKIQVQNKKLRDYAFANSHEVRAPLSNLLGLINISSHKNITKEEIENINEKICYSASELKKVITKVNKLLKEEQLT